MNNNPFIPIKKANIAIVAGNADEKILKNLENKGIRVIKTIKCEDVDTSIAYHPDIVMHPIDYNTLIIAPNVFSYYEEKLGEFKIKLIKGEKSLSSKYPGDIPYNVGRVYGNAVHNFSHTDELLKFHLLKQGLNLIDVKQGYSKCSMAIVDQRSIITTDTVIYKELKNIGIDVLKISPGYIKLEGQNYGFIGGCTGNISKDKILFSGSLLDHPDIHNIEKFIHSKGIEIEYLIEEDIVDIGTILTFYFP